MSARIDDPAQTESCLEQLKRELRAQFSARPLTAQERRAAEDEAWASRDEFVQATYRGQFVVPFGRRIIAYGTDATEVLRQAAAIAGCDVEDLPLVGIDDPIADVAH
jgi:hypothetical protein